VELQEVRTVVAVRIICTIRGARLRRKFLSLSISHKRASLSWQRWGRDVRINRCRRFEYRRRAGHRCPFTLIVRCSI